MIKNKKYLSLISFILLCGCASETFSESNNTSKPSSKVQRPFSSFKIKPNSGPREDRSFKEDTVEHYYETKNQFSGSKMFKRN